MEQQREDWETISYLGNEEHVRFIRGCYQCKGVEGSFSTIENLKNAWIKELTEAKRLELYRLMKKLREYPKKRCPYYAKSCKRLLEEKEKWQITKLGK